jgi:curved DNA-binding protein CbpA
LGVSAEAEAASIDAAYKTLMKRYHPDAQRGGAGADAQAKAINEAYRVLRNPDTRARYDRDLAAGLVSPNARRPGHDEGQPKAAPARGAAPPEKETNGPISLAFMILALMVIVGALGSFAIGLGLWRLDTSPPQADQTAAASPQGAGPAGQDASSSAADGPSFDCNTADTEVLRMICGSPELAADDASMAAAYEDALKTRGDHTALENEQSQWLLARDRMAPDRQALADFYVERISQLKSYAAKAPASF